MKNYEKYVEEIKKFDGSPDFCEQKILKPLGKSCQATDCCYCNLLKILWMLDEYEEPEADWSKVAVDTPILVRQGEDGEWTRRYFAKYENGLVYAWSDGCTRWTAYRSKYATTKWKYAKLAESEEE